MFLIDLEEEDENDDARGQREEALSVHGWVDGLGPAPSRISEWVWEKLGWKFGDFMGIGQAFTIARK